MEAELSVCVWTVVEVGHHCCSHGRVAQGRRAVLQGLAHSQDNTQHEEGELSSRGDHFTGRRADGRAAGAPASCPPGGARVAERRRGAGEKGAGKAGPAPGAGGRSEHPAPRARSHPAALPAGRK